MLLFLLLCPSRAATLLVDPLDSAAWPLIQDAIDAAEDGDTIDIAAGTFSECLDTSGKDLALVGVTGETFLDGSSRCDGGLMVVRAGETVSVTGLSVADATRIVFLVADSTLTLSDVTRGPWPR